MFKIDPDPQFVENVPVDCPNGDGWVRQMLRTRFRVIPLDELAALDQGDGTGKMGVEAVLDRVVVGFEDLADERGQPLADPRGEWRARLLQMPFLRLELLRHYSAAVARLSLGNSASSVAAGQPVN